MKDDIRAQYAPGALDRYRFVQNGVCVTQARTYDIAPDPGFGFVLKARVLAPSELSNAIIRDPLGTLTQNSLDFLARFAGTGRRIGLKGRDTDALDAALAQSGFFQPMPNGVYLESEGFFWVGAACITGRFTFKAWKYASFRFDNFMFSRLLFASSPTRVVINPPRQLSPFDIDGRATIENKYPRSAIDNDGLADTGTLSPGVVRAHRTRLPCRKAHHRTARY